jgi:hypothetical protein
MESHRRNDVTPGSRDRRALRRPRLVGLSAFAPVSNAINIYNMIRIATFITLSVLFSASQSSVDATPFSDGRVTVDCVDAVWLRQNGASSLSRDNMCSACARGFTLLRVAGFPFWPSEFEAANASGALWADLDATVADAQACNCTLLVDLFWNIFSLPDVVGEPLGVMTDLSAPSRARDAQLSIARTAAARYDDRVIVGWELTNEFNLLMDLDMSTQNNDCIDTSRARLRRARVRTTYPLRLRCRGRER